MEKKNKISILNFDLSNNSLGRSFILAQALSDTYDVKILGPAIKGSIWEPLRDSGVEFVQLPYARFPSLLFKLPSILKKIDGDIVYAVKPRFTSYGFAILKKLVSGTPVILDIDDWEISSYLTRGFWSRFVKFLNVTNPNSFFWTWLLEFFIFYADAKTTVSTFLKQKFGGEIIPHVKDTDLFAPERYNAGPLKASLGLEGKKIVMFAGTPREHKGVKDALDAVMRINDPDLMMVVVGGDHDGVYEKRLKNIGSDRLQIIGRVAYEDMPRYLMLADVVVIPQRQDPNAVGQLPSKLFDAMAMARPIVTSRISDIPEIVNGCGIVVAPGSVSEISEAISFILRNPAEGLQMGLKARQRCIDLYSVSTARRTLKGVIDGIMAGYGNCRDD